MEQSLQAFAPREWLTVDTPLSGGGMMQSSLTTSGVPAVQVPVMVAAELQDSLLVVMHDLQRLEGLLSHATDNLLERFGEAFMDLIIEYCRR